MKIKWHIKEVNISELKPYEKNPRIFSEKRLNDLRKSIQRFGVAEPIVINKDKTIIGGHARYLILKEQNIEKVEVYEPNRQLSEKEVEELNIRLNKNIAGDFDYDKLEKLFNIDDLIEWGFEAEEFDPELLNKDSDEEDLFTHFDEKLKRTSQVFTLDNSVMFELGVHPYDMPPYKKDMFLKPEELNHNFYYGKETEEPPPYFIVFGYYPIKKRLAKNGIIAFYIDDSRFENVYYDINKYTINFLNAEVLACITPDYSTYLDWAESIRIFNIYRGRYCARYFQEAGIKIIPNLTGCNEFEAELTLFDVPKNGIVALQLHQEFRTNSDIDRQKKILRVANRLVDPEVYLIYAVKNNLQYFEEEFKDRTLVVYETLISYRQKAMKKIRSRYEQLEREGKI